MDHFNLQNLQPSPFSDFSNNLSMQALSQLNQNNFGQNPALQAAQIQAAQAQAQAAQAQAAHAAQAQMNLNIAAAQQQAQQAQQAQQNFVSNHHLQNAQNTTLNSIGGSMNSSNLSSLLSPQLSPNNLSLISPKNFAATKIVQSQNMSQNLSQNQQPPQNSQNTKPENPQNQNKQNTNNTTRNNTSTNNSDSGHDDTNGCSLSNHSSPMSNTRNISSLSGNDVSTRRTGQVDSQNMCEGLQTQSQAEVLKAAQKAQAEQVAQAQAAQIQAAQAQAVQAQAAQAQAAQAQAAHMAQIQTLQAAQSLNTNPYTTHFNPKAYEQAKLDAENLSITPEKTGSKKTAYNEKWGVKVLKAWLIEKNIDTDFEVLPCDQLDVLLTKFWMNVRKSNGDYYGRNSLFNLRFVLGASSFPVPMTHFRF